METTTDQVRYATTVLRQCREDLEQVLLELAKQPHVVEYLPNYSSVWSLNKEIVRAISELTRYELSVLDSIAWSKDDPVTKALSNSKKVLDRKLND